MNNLIQQIGNLPTKNVDSTSYIYTHAKEPVPISIEILNFQYFDSYELEKSGGESGILKTTIEEEVIKENSKLSLQYSDAILLILIGLFSLIAFVRISGKNYLHRIINSVSNYSYAHSFFKERNLAYTLFNNILMFVFFIAAGMGLVVVVKQFGLPELLPGRWQQFFLYTGMVLFGVVLYKVVYRLFGAIVGIYPIVNEYLFFFGNMLKILGIAYVILLFGSHFTGAGIKNYFIYLFIFLTILAFFVKIYRILVIFFRNRFPLYYMILYFCALEIIPVVLLIKILLVVIKEEFTFIELLV